MTSLGIEIAKLSNPTPQILDPEDEENPDTFAKVSSYEETPDTYQKSILRSRTAPLLEDVDPAYIGRKVSRKSRGLIFNKEESLDDSTFISEKDDLNEDLSDANSESSNEDFDFTDEEDGEELNEDSILKFKNKLQKKPTTSDSEEKEDQDSSDSDDEIEKDDMITQFSNIDVNSEIEKGKAIKAQQEVWNRLCESRIKLQKLLIISNKLPQTDCMQLMKNKGGENMTDLINKGNDSVKVLLNSLINLQCEISKRNTKEDDKSVNEMEIPSDSEDEHEDSNNEASEDEHETSVSETDNEKGMKRKCKNEYYSEVLAKRFKSEKPHRNAIIQKWDEKVRLSTGRMTQKSFNAFGNSAVKQIEQILQDKTRLIRRTQLKRSAYQVIGKPELSENENTSEQDPISKQDMLLKDYDPQIFDDDDFYRQLLKDIIQGKTFGIDPSVVRKQMELQKIRNKMKRKVDTKASKGRKLRFDVHPKLVNYMAHVQTSTVSDEARENILKCLFGKGTMH